MTSNFGNALICGFCDCQKKTPNGLFFAFFWEFSMTCGADCPSLFLVHFPRWKLAVISHGMCNLLLEELSIEITLRAGYSSSQRWWKLWWCSQLLPTWPPSEASCLEYPGKHDKLDLQHDFNQNPGLQTALYHIGP